MICRTVLSFVLFLALTACETEKPGEVAPPPPPPKPSLNQTEVSDDLLTVASDMNNWKAPIEENLYGKFFNNRAEFYVIKNPKNKIYDASVHSIVLFYLDGSLCQTKYVMQEDITNELINSYGKFKITPHDQQTRAIVKTNQIVVRARDHWRINEGMTNYEITWNYGDKQIRYRVDPANEQEPFQYYERLKAYEKIYRELEHTGG